MSAVLCSQGAHWICGSLVEVEFPLGLMGRVLNLSRGGGGEAVLVLVTEQGSLKENC